jgi:hypothetical protein
MTMEKTIDGALIDLVPNFVFKGSLDFPGCRYFALLSLTEKGREKGSLFFQAQVLATATSLAWSLHCADSQPIVTGNHLVNHGNRRPGMCGDLGRFSWIDQRVVDNEPAKAYPRPWILSDSHLDGFRFQMRGSACDSGHLILQYLRTETRGRVMLVWPGEKPPYEPVASRTLALGPAIPQAMH